MDENGFMTGPSQDVENFVGQVLCVQMYDFVFQISEANQNDALNMCEDAPAPGNITIATSKVLYNGLFSWLIYSRGF